MKKLTQLQLLLLVAVVALIGLGVYFTVVIVQQVQAASDLETQMADVESDIASIENQYDLDALEAALATLEEDLDDSAFPKADDVENIEVNDLVIYGLQNAEVQGQRFIPEGPIDVFLNNNGTVYKAFIYEVGAAADKLPALYSFLDELEVNAPYETTVIENVVIEFVVATEEEPAYWTISIDIIVYARP